MSRLRESALHTPARASFESRGFVTHASLFSGSDLEAIASGVDQLQAWPEAPGRWMQYFDPAPDTPEGRRLNRIENFAPYHPGLDAILRGPALLGVASELLGEPAALFKDKINLKLPGGGGFDPHQDAQAGWSRYAEVFVTAAVAIDPATPRNGCLELARWPHRRELIGSLWQPLTGEELTGIPFEPLPMQPGDAVFFDAYLPHRSGPNRTDHARRVLYVTYNRASEGDHREQYYTDKRRTYPPDCERDPRREYAYRV